MISFSNGSNCFKSSQLHPTDLGLLRMLPPFTTTQSGAAVPNGTVINEIAKFGFVARRIKVFETSRSCFVAVNMDKLSQPSPGWTLKIMVSPPLPGGSSPISRRVCQPSAAGAVLPDVLGQTLSGRDSNYKTLTGINKRFHTIRNRCFIRNITTQTGSPICRSLMMASLTFLSRYQR